MLAYFTCVCFTQSSFPCQHALYSGQRNYVANAFLSSCSYALIMRDQSANYLVFGQIAHLEKFRKKYS